MSTNSSIAEAQRKHLDQQVLAFMQALTTSRFLSDQYQTLVNHIRQIGHAELQQFQQLSIEDHDICTIGMESYTPNGWRRLVRFRKLSVQVVLEQ